MEQGTPYLRTRMGNTESRMPGVLKLAFLGGHPPSPVSSGYLALSLPSKPSGTKQPPREQISQDSQATLETQG